jgi:LysM repeat protein
MQYKTNITTGATVLLKAGETISHIAVGTKYTTKELLQYNNLTEQQAKNLPVGYEVQIPKNVQNLQGGYGNVKLYEGHDGSLTYHIPADKDGSIKVVKLDKYGKITPKVQFFNKTDFPTIAHKWKEKTDSAANIQEDDLPF